MLKSTLIFLAAIGLFFIDINTIAIPYFLFVLGYLIYMIRKKYYNEIALVLPLFGYSTCLFLSKLLGVINLGLLLGIVMSFCVYYFIVKSPQFRQLKYGVVLLALYSILLVLILLSFYMSYSDDYQLLKMRLFITWFLILFLSINCFNQKVTEFNFEEFLILSFLFFVPHFSAAESEGLTLSPKEVWEIYSVLDDGIRGHDFDIITATRISGVGILAFFIYLLDFNPKKMYLGFMMLFFFVMIIVCQTRQSIVALFLPILIFMVYVLKKESKNYFAILLGICLCIYSIKNYLTYLDDNGVKSRVVTNVEGTSKEGSGREIIWEQAIDFINTNNGSVGFGNFKTFVKAHEYPHNIFLEFLIEIGLMATMVLIIIVAYILIEVYRLLFVYETSSKLELFLLLATIYFFALAQFSVDLPRNMIFFFTFALFLGVKNQQKLT